MCRQTIRFAIGLLVLCLSESGSWAQFGGSRAGAKSDSEAVAGLPVLEREVVEGFIAIDGRAEVRVRPTEIRMVLALASEGPTDLERNGLINEAMVSNVRLYFESPASKREKKESDGDTK